jgi:hypothetical protein
MKAGGVDLVAPSSARGAVYDEQRAAAEDSDRLHRIAPRLGRIENPLGITFVL